MTAVGKGRATITVKTTDGGFEKICAVTVLLPVEGVSLDKKAIEIEVGETTQLTATIEPAGASNQNVTWSSSPESIATVSETGLVTAVGAGTATITVTTADGDFPKTCTVTVTPAVTKVMLSALFGLELEPGGTHTLTATVEPTGANQTVTWSSDNESVATVDENGKVIAVAEGTATITCTTVKGNKTASRKVTVMSLESKYGMVAVEGGTFQMGDAALGEANPVHQVTLSAFSIGKYPVTQQQWMSIMNGDNPGDRKGLKFPVDRVSWNDVQRFIEKLNQQTGRKFALPTEAQWEYAARGGNKSKNFTYSGSNDINEVAWFNHNSGGLPHDVGTKAQMSSGCMT